MTVLQALLLGIMQGLTEFLPVSSSGHLVLVPWLLGWPTPSLLFDAAVHLATLVAVVVYFWQDILALVQATWQMLRERRVATSEARLALLIVASAVPGALAGYFLESTFERLFDAPWSVALLLIVTGCLLILSERLSGQRAGRQQAKTTQQMSLGDALWIGLAQAVAIAPGVSRSGATISAGLLCGLSRRAASRFAFLMSLPIILGAAAFTILDAAGSGTMGVSALNLAAGLLGAGVSGYFAIRFLLNYIQRHSLIVFAIYVWLLAAFILVMYWLG